MKKNQNRNPNIFLLLFAIRGLHCRSVDLKPSSSFFLCFFVLFVVFLCFCAFVPIKFGFFVLFLLYVDDDGGDDDNAASINRYVYTDK